ncbi:cryptochrome/photolyase family protein [Skermania piniformis]|uniref:DNA photolyase family protein n=1 Tax=Skermania pinensis TaxID=39122 RepID=A0ABX8SFD4_9ACTN|nr:deoxyribodipyrimidine photo-lyase [Skermania piniformis]QXQ15647.1 DNA photolyase family protein [Skermania piniformis]
MTRTAVVWFRRDLRLHDLPTSAAAAAAGDQALALFVLDDALLRPSGAARTAFLYRCLRALDADLGGRLLVLRGDPVAVLPQVVEQVGADSVHISADYAPYGAARDAAVAERVPLVRTGSPYAVAPGRIRKADGTPYRVFTPFSRAWHEHGWRSPARTAADTVAWLDPTDFPGRVEIPDDPALDAELPPAGERAALAAWRQYRDEGLAEYPALRDRPDRDATSRLSPYLKFGCLHPRTLLAEAAAGSVFVTELAWREFYADVLFHRPETARHNYITRFDRMGYATGPEADELFAAWCAGRTGYPIVDAGMRQLLAEGWMHNRVRMITASFLTKDLHLPWWWGARHFLRYLVDGDLASNQHGWQWVAGTGTDASPFVRVFNPLTQGEKFDPAGDYVRRWVPELRGVAGKAVHRVGAAPPVGYPPPIVDHAIERRVALDRYEQIRDR